MVNTILTAIGVVAALGAAVCAFLALRKATETITVARDTLGEAIADRRVAEQERERRRIKHVGEVVEAVASAAADPYGRFHVHRNRLHYALVGLDERLPQCVALVNEVKSKRKCRNT